MTNILLHTSEADNSTNQVLSWLYYIGNCNIRRLNNKIPFPQNGILLSNKNANTKIPFKHINQKYWYRRGSFEISAKTGIPTASGRLIDYVDRDLNCYTELCNVTIKEFSPINRPLDNDINKLLVLKLAEELSILFPNTYIGKELANCPFKAPQYSAFITKSLNFPNLVFRYKEKIVQFYSSTILIKNDTSQINHLAFSFFPSLFQEYIEKKYEIRSFYLKGVFKSMAIFSQQNEKTKIDFRNYDYERPNRCVPYNLPKSLEKKLHKLMLKLDINCGSMDILVTPNDEYYFLEVNPIGQFQWLSHNCNYFIERMIANDLCS